MTKINKQIAKRIYIKNHTSLFKLTIKFHDYNIYWWGYPIGVVVALLDEHQQLKYNTMKWDELRAKKMADKYFGKCCSIDENGNVLWFCTDWSTGIWRSHSNRFDREWLSKFSRKMHEYIVDSFQIDGYDKEVEDEWVKFTKRR